MFLSQSKIKSLNHVQVGLLLDVIGKKGTKTKYLGGIRDQGLCDISFTNGSTTNMKLLHIISKEELDLLIHHCQMMNEKETKITYSCRNKKTLRRKKLQRLKLVTQSAAEELPLWETVETVQWKKRIMKKSSQPARATRRAVTSQNANQTPHGSTWAFASAPQSPQYNEPYPLDKPFSWDYILR
jgi:hypothetical protein